MIHDGLGSGHMLDCRGKREVWGQDAGQCVGVEIIQRMEHVYTGSAMHQTCGAGRSR